IPVHLCRGPVEPINADLQQFYDRLLACLRLPVASDGQWQLLECTEAWNGNWTWDGFICSAWRQSTGSSLIVAVNYAGNQGQCFAHIPQEVLKGEQVQFRDLMGPAVYNRRRSEILSQGLNLDMPPWGYNVFELTT